MKSFVPRLLIVFALLAALLFGAAAPQPVVPPEAPAVELVIPQAGPATALASVTAPLLEAFPLLSLLLASALVILAAAIVQPATEWFKVRLENRMGNVPHPLIHAINLLLSLGVGLLFLGDGRLSADPFFGGIPWPWNVLIFAAAVFLRAGGWFDSQIKNKQLAAGS